MTPEDEAVIRFERQWFRYSGAKAVAIRDQLGLTETRYYQRLNALLDDPGALAFDAQLVNRLRYLREQRVRRI